MPSVISAAAVAARVPSILPLLPAAKLLPADVHSWHQVKKNSKGKEKKLARKAVRACCWTAACGAGCIAYVSLLLLSLLTDPVMPGSCPHACCPGGMLQ